MIVLVAVAFAGTWDLVADRREDGVFILPSPAERAAYAALVRDLARSAPSGIVPADAPARAEALGLVLRVEGGAAWLMEPIERLRGGGVVAVRLGPLATEVVLQAPHPTSDLHTGPIVAELFDSGAARAACFATAHRRAAEGSDAARSTDGMLQAATEGLAEGLKDPLFVQIHGFGADTSQADLVLSEGATRVPPEVLDAARRRIATALGAGDARLGADVPALSARGNVQGQYLADRARFLHLELSLAMRVSLSEDAVRRQALGVALRDVALRVAR